MSSARAFPRGRVHGLERRWGAVAVPVVTSIVRRDLGAALFIAAVVSGAVPTIATALASVLLIFWPLDRLLLVFLASAALAFALAISGLLLVWPYRSGRTLLLAAVPFFALNLGIAALTGYAYLGSISCSVSGGACFGIVFLCGGGFMLDLIAAVLVAIGVVQLRRPSGLGYVLPPPWPPP